MINFFNYFQLVEHEVNEDTDYFTDKSRTAIHRLGTYIESADIASGEATAFICKRWRLNTKELVEEWQKETGVLKSSAAFRSQISSLSKTLYSLFPEEAFGELLSDNNPERINQTLDALKYDNKPFSILFPELNKYAGYPDTRHYSLEEMSEEIKVLRAIKTVEARYKSLDSSKLGYIKQALDSRVINNPAKPELLRALALY
jgi:hypothetical protein